MNFTRMILLLRESISTFAVLRRSPAEIRQISRARLEDVLEAANNTKFWRPRLEAAGLEAPRNVSNATLTRAFRDLPPVSKGELREAGADALNGERVDLTWHTSRSSGSTGEPFRTYFDPRAWVLLKYLAKLRARVACGVRPHHRLAIVEAFPPGERRQRLVERTGRVRGISALQAPVTVARELANFAPDGVYGAPSVLQEAARVSRAAGVPNVRPKWIFTSGELLTPGLRSELELNYGCRVFDIYGSTETKEIAWECVAGSMHVNSDVVKLEVLDDDGSLLPEGEEGRLAVTVLVNTAMPLLRYVIGDRGSLIGGLCTCGCSLPRMGVVTGRDADVLTVNGRRVVPYVLICAIRDIAGIRRFQIQQTATGVVIARAVLDGTRPSAEVRVGIEDALKEALGETIVARVEFLDSFPSTGKFHVVRGPGREPDSQP